MKGKRGKKRWNNGGCNKYNGRDKTICRLSKT